MKLIARYTSTAGFVPAVEMTEERAQRLATQYPDMIVFFVPIPHDWRRDKDGLVFQFWDHCDGPECVRCGLIFCEHCDFELWDSPCGEQTPYLF